MTSFYQRLRCWSWENRLLFAVTIIAVFPALFSLWPSTPKASPAQASSVDTYIPKGFVLIPIELANYEALDSVFGRFGLVDLYSGGENGSESRLVARAIRLLRAPQNPTRFAVLVPETQASRLLKSGGPFNAIVRRPGSSGTEFVDETSKPRRKIIYEGDRG